MSGIGSIFGHPNAVAKANGGSALDGQSPITMAQQFGSVAPLTLPSVSRQVTVAIPDATSIPATSSLTLNELAFLVPAGQKLVLERIAWIIFSSVSSGIFPRFVAGSTWEGTDYLGEATPNLVLVDNSSGTTDIVQTVGPQVYNSNASSITTNPYGSIWYNLRVE